MGEAKKDVRIFNEEKQRIKAANRVMYMISMVLNFALLPGTLLVVLGGSKEPHTIFITLVVLLSMTLSTVLYFKDKMASYLKYVFVLGFYISYFEIVVLSNVDYVSVYFLALILGSILYLDRKFTLILGGMGVGACGIKVAYTLVAVENLTEDAMNNITTQFWAMLAVTWAITITMKYVMRFIEDMLFAVKDEKEVQQQLVDEILQTASVVRNGATSLKEIISNVGGTAVVVNDSMEKISNQTFSTTEAIQGQNLMTQSIQEAIATTLTQSRNTVQTALNTEQTIAKSMAVVDELRGHSSDIAQTNSEVVVAMEKLQSKTEEVRGIAGMIIDISSQTNLLSLNASIESARAGELGRGFAVVAEEIRKLSEETRTSTESITNIIEELNSNALLATNIVKGSIEAVERQGKLIEETAASYHAIDEDVKAVVDNVSGIDSMINSLYESNNKLVDSVNLLNANSEQINENSKQAASLSHENMSRVEEANDLLGEVMEAVSTFEKYSL